MVSRGRVEERVDDNALGRRQDHVVDELFVLDVAAVAADELDSSAGKRDPEDAGVRGVREVEPDHLTMLLLQRQIGRPLDKQQVAEPAHRRVGCLGSAERRHFAVLDQDVIERQGYLAGAREASNPGRRGLDDHVAVRALFPPVVLADVRGDEVHAGVGER